MSVYNEPFDCTEILRDVLATISPLAMQGGNQIHFDCLDELPIITTDLVKFQQIFLNLLSNACKFTENGDITLRAKYIDESASEQIQFEVSDNGIGMTEEQSEIIFDEFSQADSSTTRKYGGTGLGLTLCKKYCELLGGSIGVCSQLGRGTTFTISLPVHAM